MEKPMKKLSTFLSKTTLILSAFVCTAYADSSYDNWNAPCESTCCPSRCGPSFRVGVDFLLWKPDIDDTDFATTTRTVNLTAPVVPAPVLSITPKYWGIHQDWEPGVRFFIGGDNLFCGWDVEASYAYVSIAGFGRQEITEQPAPGIGRVTFDSIISPILPINLNTATLGFFQTAESRYNANYHVWDVLASYNFSCKPCLLDLFGFMGPAGLYLTQHWKTDYAVPEGSTVIPAYAGDTATVVWDSNYWGVGLKVGTGLSYELFEHVNLFAKGAAVLLTGSADGKTNFTSFDADITESGVLLNSNYKDTCNSCHFVPGYHIQAGGRISFETCGTTIGLRAGYEFQGWYNVPTLRRFMGESIEGISLSTSSNTTTFGIHGMFFGADVGF